MGEAGMPGEEKLQGRVCPSPLCPVAACPGVSSGCGSESYKQRTFWGRKQGGL